MKKIIFITHGYPIIGKPANYQFVKELVDQWRNQGLEVQVINPLSLKDWIKNRKNNKKDEVFPLYIRLAFLKFFPFLRVLQNRVQDFFFRKAVEKHINSYDDVVLYSHFLIAGNIAAQIAEKHKVKAYCAFGESTLWFLQDRRKKDVDKNMRLINGFVSVSSQNTRILREMGWGNNIIELPNAIDLQIMKIVDKAKCREELSFPKDNLIGIFVGHFIERKGPLRVMKAVHGIDRVKMIYIGSGEQVPNDDNILFCGPVNHSELYKYLCASDFFILPTSAEGCCNAIVEALGCSLPIISSDGEFNDGILDNNNSIRVRYDDIRALRDAVIQMCNDDKRESMAKYIASQRNSYSLENRASKIAEFIQAK